MPEEKPKKPETVGERFARRLNEGLTRVNLFLFKILTRDTARKYWAAHVVWNTEHYLMWSDDGEEEMAGPFEDPGDEFQVIHHNGKPIFIASRGHCQDYVFCGMDEVAGPFDMLVDLRLTDNQSIAFTEYKNPDCDYGPTNHHAADISGFYR